MGRPVTFDLATGGGSTSEYLMGEVTLQPTLMHTVNTRVVLPDTVTLPLANGKATHPDVAPSPAGPEPEWAYKITIRSGITGKAWAGYYGVPTGTGSINFKDLTEFTTTIPPHTTADMLQNWVDTTETNATRAENAADRAEAPTDEMLENLLGNASSSAYNAMDLATRTRLAPARNVAPLPAPSRIITTFQTGHGWTVIEGTGTLTADTTDTVRGTRSAVLTTPGDGTPTTIGINGLPTMDLKRHYVRVTLKLNDWSHANQLGVRVRAGLNIATRYRERSLSPAAENTDFGGSGKPKLIGGNNEWQTSTVSFSITNGSVLGSAFDFSACTAIGLTVQDRGAPITMHISEVALIPKPDAYPHGVVSITFDDGRTSQWDNAYPILSARGLPATMFVIRDRTDAGTHVTHDNLKAMQNAGWEIAAHTNTLTNHDLTRGFVSLTADQLAQDLAEQKQWMIQHGYNGAEYSAYPQGWYSKETVDVAKQYLTSVRTTITDDGLETLPPADPYRVRCVHIADNTNFATVQTQIDRAYEYGDWLILYTHDVLDGSTGASTTPAMLTQIADYLVTKGIPVRTYGEVLRTVTTVPPAEKFVPPEPPHILGPLPEEYGLLGWNFDPLMASDDVQSAPAGKLLGTRVYAKPGTLIAGVNIAFKATVPLTATNCWVGVYTASGTKLTAVTGDQATNFNTGGERRFGMPTFTMPAEGYVYVVLLVGSSTSLPAWCGRAGDRVSSFGFPGAGRSARAFTVGTGLTSLPTTIDMSTITRTNNVPWIGLSV